MTNFQTFSKLVHAKFVEMSANELFVVGEDNRQFEQVYLNAFPEGTNPPYKTNTEHDCSCCKNFIRNIGNLATLQDGVMTSVWDIKGAPYPYDVVASKLSEYIKTLEVASIFRTKERQYGAEETKQLLEDKSVKRWNHFYGTVAARHFSETPDTAKGIINTNRQVFERGLKEITAESLVEIIGLIERGDLYRGAEHLKAVKAFQALQKKFNGQGNFTWEHAQSSAATFRNTVIGTLAQDLSEGKDLEGAVKSFEAKVAPTNYKRTTALITPAMVKMAQAKLKELDLEGAVERRFARISDITPNNVLWVDGKAKRKMKGSAMDNLLTETLAKREVTGTVEISIADFMATVLPTAVEMQVKLKNAHKANFVALTAPVNENTGKLFKWGNDFAWSYVGNIADSELRKQVSARGGRVDGVFRFSHSWNYDKRNASLMDLHVFMPTPKLTHEDGCHDKYPTSRRVGWNHRGDSLSGGVQDVDYVAEAPVGYVPVENITFPDLSKMPEGEYVCKVHNWNLRNPTQGGFKAEIEFAGSIYEYEHEKPLKQKEWVTVAVVTLKAGVFSIEHKLPMATASTTLWGVPTEQLVKVDTVMYSPNFWDEQEVGNKHWFFMLEGCKSPDPVRGMYNEFLRGELEAHRKTFEVLGERTKCEVVDEQLCGVGFSSTQRNSIEVVVTTAKNERSYVVNF